MEKKPSFTPASLLALLSVLIRRHGGLRLSEKDTATLANVMGWIADSIESGCLVGDVAIAEVLIGKLAVVK